MKKVDKLKRVIWFTFVILTTLAVFILLWQFSIAIVLFVLSLAVAAAVGPAIQYWTEHHFPRSVALGLVYSLAIGFVVLIIAGIGPSLFHDIQKVTEDFVTSYDRIIMEWPRGGSLFQQAIAEQLPPTNELFNALTSKEGFSAVMGVLGVAQNLFTVFGRIAIVFILSIYWSADQLRFERLGLSLFSQEYHSKVKNIWLSMEAGVGAYLRSEFVQSILAGCVLGIGYWLMGVRYPTLLAIWVAIARVIPWFGALIAVILPLLVAIGISPGLGVWVAGYTVFVLILMKLVIEPRFFRRSRYNSLLIIVFVIALAEVFGVIGVMLAPPLAVAVQILFHQLFPPRSELVSQELVERAKYLHGRVARLEKQIRRKNHNSTNKMITHLEDIQYLINTVIVRVQDYR